MSDARHGNAVHATKPVDSLSWFGAAPGRSAELIAIHASHRAGVDIGAGAARLVDHRRDAGFAPITALDISAAGLAISQARPRRRAAAVNWVGSDATAWAPSRRHGRWHDGAVFHVLTAPGPRAAYARALDAATAPGAVAIIASAADGPETCSGLPVQRDVCAELAAEIEWPLPGVFTPVEGRRHADVTPGGGAQHFQVSVLRKAG